MKPVLQTLPRHEMVSLIGGHKLHRWVFLEERDNPDPQTHAIIFQIPLMKPLCIPNEEASGLLHPPGTLFWCPEEIFYHNSGEYRYVIGGQRVRGQATADMWQKADYHPQDDLAVKLTRIKFRVKLQNVINTSAGWQSLQVLSPLTAWEVDNAK